jgi:cell division protein FtsN
MARNYPEPQRRSTQSSSQTFKQWMWIVGAFIAGYFISALYDVASFKQWFQTTLIDGYFKKHPTVVMTQAPVVPPKPKLEFYTLLAKGEQAEVKHVSAATEQVQINHSATSPSAGSVSPPSAKVESLNAPIVKELTSSKLAPAIASAEHYTVQLAAFGNRSDAEKMKAAFLLKGFNVSLVMIEQNHIQWYRVILGPFVNRGEAEAAQHAVAKRERISGMIRKAST